MPKMRQHIAQPAEFLGRAKRRKTQKRPSPVRRLINVADSKRPDRGCRARRMNLASGTRHQPKEASSLQTCGVRLPAARAFSWGEAERSIARERKPGKIHAHDTEHVGMIIERALPHGIAIWMYRTQRSEASSALCLGGADEPPTVKRLQVFS